MKYMIIYFVIVNLVTFFMYGIDKLKAKYNKWRISESMLISLAVIGGFIGAYAGMQLFRHKTKHLKFTLGVPIISILWIGLIIAYVYFFR